MDCDKIGALISGLRKEKGLTQKQLADKMNVSDRTVSKWERGAGCPDVSLLRELSGIFEVNIESILAGELEQGDANGGNMKKLKFYVCPACGNILTATGEAEVFCCGRKLAALIPKPSDEAHRLVTEPVEDELYITSPHEMSKDHFLNFIALVSYDRVTLVRLYPEQSCGVRLPRYTRGTLYFGCSKHGLWVSN